MVSKAETTSTATAPRPDAVLRPARPDDCRRIAELFRIASDGVADYVWSRLQDDYPGHALIEIGERRYARENTAFSYRTAWSPSRTAR